jgi:endonuclease/exonuclease/phosphatase family metal-dependent hydrolase
MASIDWILVSDHFRVLDAQIDRSRQGNLFPSDHYPITAVLDWKA